MKLGVRGVRGDIGNGELFVSAVWKVEKMGGHLSILSLIPRRIVVFVPLIICAIVSKAT